MVDHPRRLGVLDFIVRVSGPAGPAGIATRSSAVVKLRVGCLVETELCLGVTSSNTFRPSGF